MKRSEVLETVLASYYFQEGKRAKTTVTNKIDTMIKQCKKAEAASEAQELAKPVTKIIREELECSA